MPAARGVKRSASKASTSTAATEPKNKKKRGVIQLDIPKAPKRKGCIYTCGQGDVGQLGLGEDVMETTKFKQVTKLPNKMVDVIAGGMHTLALDSDGKIWSWGCNDEGALGRPTGDDEGTPGLVSLPGPAVQMSAGDSHSAALLEDGQVWAWGSFRDSHGSMGLVVRAREGKPCKEPARLPVPPAAGIASGGDHLVVLDTAGNVYTMGCGEQGQLGRLAQRSASRDARQGFGALLVPSKVVVKGGATRVWAGSHATFALAAGRVLAWGLNNYGQLGVTGEKRKTALYSPTECDALPGDQWQTLSAGQHHTLALDSAGRLHALGRCEYGRLGLGDRVGDAETLEAIPKLQNKKCVSISTGTCNSFAVTDEGEVFAWGMGSEGQLGTGGAADQLEPTPALLPPAVAALRVAAGGQHAALLVEDPDAQKEASPTPEEEKEEEKVEEVAEEKEEKEKEKRPTKRQKKEQDGEISSTSSAQPSSVTDDQPEKVNGDEKKQTAMEVDETVTEKPEEIKGDTKTDKQNDEQETTEPESDKGSKDDMDTSSQDTVESEKEKDVEMKGVNGTDETNETSETKPKETGDETIASEAALVSA